MTVPVASLLRLSTERQARKQTGGAKGELDIPSQRQTITEFLAARPEWNLVREFAEAGVSAFSNSATDREVLQDVLGAAAAGQFKVLIIWKQDRLSRNSLEYPVILNVLRKYGVEVWSVSDGKALALDSQTDKVVRFLEGWQAESESINTSIRTRERMRQLAAEGCWTGGKTPWGYERVMVKDEQGNPALVAGKPQYVPAPHPEHASVVREIFHRYIRGAGYKALAVWLNATGVPTYSGGPWGFHTVRDIVCNPFYAGFVRYGETRVILGTKLREKGDPILAPGKHQAIIDMRTWESAVQLRSARSTIPKRQRSSELPLSGIVRCALCGSTLFQWIKHYQPKEGAARQYRMYRCTTRKIRNGCDFTGVNAQAVEEAFVTALEREFTTPTGLRAFLEEQNKAGQAAIRAAHDTRKRAEKRLKQVEDALRRLDQAFLEQGVYAPAEYKERKDHYQAERGQLDEEIARPLPEVQGRDVGALVDLVKDLRANWYHPMMTPEKKKTLALNLVKAWGLTVLVHPDKRVEIIAE